MTATKETVGELITRMFPQGFIGEQYYYLMKENDEVRSLSFLKKILRSGGFVKIPKSRRKILNKYHAACAKQNNKIRKILKGTHVDDAFMLPPISPFDLFAIASTLLVNSGAYHHFEAKFYGARLRKFDEFPTPRKIKKVKRKDILLWNNSGDKWYEYSGSLKKNSQPFGPLNKIIGCKPQSISDFWVHILSCWDIPVYQNVKQDGDQPFWWKSAFALLAISDTASKNVGFRPGKRKKGSGDNFWTYLTGLIFEEFAQTEVEEDGERSYRYVELISFADRDIVNVLPKSCTAQLGCTLRSLSHNLAKLPARGRIRAGWTLIDTKQTIRRNTVFNILLVPYPYIIKSFNFVPTILDNEDGVRWGMFSLKITPDEKEDRAFVNFICNLLEQARLQLGQIHALVLPELAVSKKTANAITKRIQNEYPTIELVCLGVRERMLPPSEKIIPSNGAYMAFFADGKKKQEFFHEKHHRWRLTEDQINMYDLSPALDPSRVWWEDIRITNRCIPFLVMRNKWTVTALICEDLARNDPAREVVEAVGPNLVISLLMDGPQIASRWPSRYATVLAEDPGSAVLSVSSFGLIERSNRKAKEWGVDPSNSIGLWKDDRGQTIPIELEKGSHAVALCVSEFPDTDITLDGRVDTRGVSLHLTGTRQIISSLREDFPPWSSTHALP